MLACLFVFFAGTCYGQQPGNDSTRINGEQSKHQIAMRLKSPVSDLVVFQLSDIVTVRDADPKATMNTFRAQPIIPIPLSENLRLVSRVTATLKLKAVTYTLDATGIDNFLHGNSPAGKQMSSNAKAIADKALKEKEQIRYTGFIA
jgi:hypothetical protein